MDITIRLISPEKLSKHDLALWRHFQLTTPCLDSPFFNPEFSQIVAEHCHNVEIAIIEYLNKVIGFFPFHRQQNNVGRSIGLSLSDFQGVISDGNISWDAAQLIEDSHLRTWHFDHLLTTQPDFLKYCWEKQASPYMNLNQGFEAYVTNQRQSGSSLIPQIKRKARKFSREIAPLHVEFHTAEKTAFDKLLAWKSQQRLQTGTFDVLSEDWATNILESIREKQTPEFAGVVSVLYAGDKIAAVHLGMRSSSVLHYWFPTYDPKFAKYSPGLILLLEMAKLGAELGITRLDLGKGGERYKTQLMSGSIELAEGWIGGGYKTWLFQGTRFQLRKQLRESTFYGPFTKVKRSLRRLHRQVKEKNRLI